MNYLQHLFKTTFCCFSILFFFAGCTFKNHTETIITHPQKLLASHKTAPDNNILFSKKVMLDRLDQYRQYLKNQGANINTSSDLLNLTSPATRKQFCTTHHIDSLWLLVHVELAQLVDIGLSEVDAQMLHFSHWNQQNPFTGEVINPSILAELDAEDVFVQMLGWQAGNGDWVVERYEIKLGNIEKWILEAKENDNYFAIH